MTADRRDSVSLLSSREPKDEPTASLEEEKRRYAHAYRDFTLAFAEGYASGKAELAAGKVSKLAGPSELFYLEVPREDVVTDRWRNHIPRFRQCGRVAAIAEARRGEAKLKLTDTERTLWRWAVDLAPDG